MNIIKKGNTVGIHYVGTLNDGTEFDNSRKRENLFFFKVGEKTVIPGFESAVVGMKVGETKKVIIEPEQAYGLRDNNLLRQVPKATFPDNFDFKKGSLVEMRSALGQPLPAMITSFDDNEVTLDFNHPLSGQTLNFEIEVIELDTEE